MKIILVNGSSTPLYEQIKDGIKENISRNNIDAGEKLPSVRKLSKELKVSILTVKKAYDELEKEGYIESRQGLGTFVSEDLSDLKREEKQKNMEDYLDKAIKISKELKLKKDTILELFEVIYGEDYDE